MWGPDSKQESGKECLRRMFYFVKSSEMKAVLEEDKIKIKIFRWARGDLNSGPLDYQSSAPNQAKLRARKY